MKLFPVPIAEDAAAVMRALERKGYQVYLVGGCVRDALLGRVPHDWDLCTSATPEEMKSCFSGFRVAETGLQHGTLTVVFPHCPVEVTTFRTEGTYTDRRHPDQIVFTRCIEEDLKRRDFTINAMAFGTECGLIDLFGGQNDLKQGLIRCVGLPEQRFQEDALRIMRCIRFASELNFAVEPSTLRAAQKMAPWLESVAVERIREEFFRLLCGPAAAQILRNGREIVACFLPEIRPMFDCAQNNDYHIDTVWEHTLHAVDAIPAEILLRLTAFFHDIGKPSCRTTTASGWDHFYHHESVGAQMTEHVLSRLHCDRFTRETVTELIRRHGIVFQPDGRQPHRLLVRMGETKLRMLIEMERADVKSQAPFCIAERLERIHRFSLALDHLLKEEHCFSVKDLQVNGNDVIQAGIPRGPQVGHVLSLLLEEVIDGITANDRSVLLRRIREMSHSDSM